MKITKNLIKALLLQAGLTAAPLFCGTYGTHTVSTEPEFENWQKSFTGIKEACAKKVEKTTTNTQTGERTTITSYPSVFEKGANKIGKTYGQDLAEKAVAKSWLVYEDNKGQQPCRRLLFKEEGKPDIGHFKKYKGTPSESACGVGCHKSGTSFYFIEPKAPETLETTIEKSTVTENAVSGLYEFFDLPMPS